MKPYLDQTPVSPPGKLPQSFTNRNSKFGKIRVIRGRFAFRRIAALFLLLLAACTSQEETPEPAASPTMATLQPTRQPTATAVPEGYFQNPIIRHDFPDPGILKVDGVYYAYATNASGRNIQLARSTDLVQWELLTDAMPSLPSWAKLGGSFIWAPEAIQIDDRFLLYYTARDKAADRQCIGVATSDKPEGKFRDNNDQPLVCQVEEGGSIDPSPFRDVDGTLYLYWKNDGNCCSQPTYLYVQELAPDGLSLVGEPVRLVRNDRAWERHVVEAPTMWQRDGRYYLFFSGNNYAGIEYAVGYAFCETATGPCEDAPENPILASAMEKQPLVVGPGHQTIVEDEAGQTWLVYHAWEVLSSGTRGSRRFVWIDRLAWDEGKPAVLGPTGQPQPAPNLDH